MTSALLLLASFLTTGFASASTVIEVPIERVLFPAQGYDDNDQVRILIEGTLPDDCYELGGRTIETDPATGIISIRQLAWRRTTGVCAGGDLLAESDFSEEVVLGTLKAGHYLIAGRPLLVTQAVGPGVDDYLYAEVTSIIVSDLVREGVPVRARITGLVSSVCHDLVEPIAVERVGDTMIIRPIEIERDKCPLPADPSGFGRMFDREIELGPLERGRYLIHVRSHHGQAKQRPFSVVSAI